MKTIILIASLLISFNINAQIDGKFGFQCTMPTGSYTPDNNLIGGLYKPESIDNYTNDPNAYFPVLIVYVQFPNDPGADVSWWPVSGNQAPTFMGNIISEFKSTNYGTNWWDAYSESNARLSDFWMEVSRGELHLVGEEVHVVLPEEYTWYGSHGGTEQIMEDLFSELATVVGSDWPKYDKWGKDGNGDFVYGTGDGFVDMIYLVARSNPSGYFTPAGVMNYCSHTSNGHTVYTSGSQTIKIKPAISEEGAGFQICGGIPLNEWALVSFSGHEHAHYLFGNGNYFEWHQQYSKVNNYHGWEEYLSPYELLRLGYHTPQVADFNDVTISIGDFSSFTTNSGSELLKVPIGSSSRNEFFLIANRQHVSIYDHLMWGDTAHDNPYRTLSTPQQDYGKGIYIYHAYPGEIQNGGNYPWGIHIDMECADGLWNWTQYGTQLPDWSCTQNVAYYKRTTAVYGLNDNGGEYNNSQSLDKHDGLSLGYYEKGNWFGIGDAVPCGSHGDGTDRNFTNEEEVWTSRELQGDRWDAWKVGYNEVFSPYSTPSTTNWDNDNSYIFIYLNSMSGTTANLEIYKIGEGGWDEEEILEVTPPSKPSLYKPVEIANCNGTVGSPRIIWNNNYEPDMLRQGSRDQFKRYKIYRAISTNPSIAPLNYTYHDTYDDHTPNDTANYIDNNALNGAIIYCGLGGANGNDTYYRYKIIAVDKYDDESVLSDFVSIKAHSIIPDSPVYGNNEAPVSFKLAQNYPNPFNPSTEIKFDLPQNSFVTLRVYNAVGQVVAELVNNEYKNAGSYAVSFDGSKLASGIYFYSIEAGVYKDVKKMVLIK